MIRLQFVLGRGLSSRLIAWYGNGYRGYSHVDAILHDGTLCGARSDAVGGRPAGVQIRPANYEKWVRRCVVTLESTEDQSARWERYLRSQVGRHYDKGSILGFVFGEEMHQAGRWICSALQTRALELVGKIQPLPTPPAQVTPNSLLIATCAVGGRASAHAG